MVIISGCTGKTLEQTSDNRMMLGSCLPLPNCVSSNASISYNRIEPFELAMAKVDAWPLIRQAVLEIPRTVIDEEADDYLHAKTSSKLFRFVDNMELLYDPDKKLVSIRSSSVLGLYDMGANRRKIESLRKVLIDKAVVRD